MESVTCLACGQGEAVRWRLCHTCGVTLAGPCLGKRRMTQHHAKSLKQKFTEMRAYPCHVCGRWHVGKILPPDIVAALEQGREAVVANLRAGGYGWLLTMLADEFDGADRARWKSERGLGTGRDQS